MRVAALPLLEPVRGMAALLIPSTRGATWSGGRRSGNAATGAVSARTAFGAEQVCGREGRLRGAPPKQGPVALFGVTDRSVGAVNEKVVQRVGRGGHRQV